MAAELAAELAAGVDSKMVSHFLGDLLNSLAGIAFADGIFRHRSVKRNRKNEVIRKLYLEEQFAYFWHSVPKSGPITQFTKDSLGIPIGPHSPHLPGERVVTGGRPSNFAAT